jgi:hypothetical protein
MSEGWLKRLVAGAKAITGDPEPISFLPAESDRKPVVPNLQAEVQSLQKPAPEKPHGELYPGRFFSFELFIALELGDTVHLGYPKVPFRDISTGVVRWISPVEWSWPDPKKARMKWIDDPERGIGARTLERVEDVLGAEGMLGERFCRFERVLEVGQNQVVYALYCPKMDARLAYGFDRSIFEPGYVKPVRSRNKPGSATEG